jgi:hypothetical protein
MYFKFIITKQIAKAMKNPILRASLTTVFCFILYGCAIGIKSTNLKDIPAQQEDSRLLTSVGFVLDDEAYINRDIKFKESERKSWIDALSNFTGRENIFTMSGGKPASIVKIRIIKPPTEPAKILPDQPPSLTDQAYIVAIPSDKPVDAIDPFPEFAKTHPIVHVHVNAVPEKEGLTGYDVLSKTPLVISFLTFWVTPAYISRPYTASFSLSMPEEKKIPPAHWDYAYDRKEYYWLPLLPVAENSITFDGKIESDMSWKVEEKRLLVLKFLEDAKSLLQEH